MTCPARMIGVRALLQALRRGRGRLAAALAVLVLAGCGGLPPLPLLAPPDSPDRLIGLAFSEEILLEVRSSEWVGITPRTDTSTIYRTVVEPGGLKTDFVARGSGGLFLAWIPADRIDGGRVTVRIISQEIRQQGQAFRSPWPEDQSPVISAAVQPGRVAWLGRVVRTLSLARDEDGEETLRANVAVDPDRDGQALWRAAEDNPWLKERLPETSAGG